MASRALAKQEGATRYFTGKPCVNGHVAERMTTNGTCVPCLRVTKNENWIKRGKPKQNLEISRRYRDKNREGLNERIYAWKKENAEAVRIHKRRARAKNPDKYRSLVRSRRARAVRAEGVHDEHDIAALFVKQGGVCVTCPADLSGAFEVDHIHPLSRGGTNWPSNLQLMCMRCNRSKGAKTMAEWAAHKMKLMS